MTVDANNARIYGSDSDAIYLAPIGTPLPSTLTEELDAAFEDVGWIHSDGITESATGSVNKIRGHQGNGVVRTRIQEAGTTIAFQALEDKTQTRELRYVIKSSTVADGVRTERRGPGQKVQARAAVIDIFDADDDTIKERLVIERLEITPNDDRVYGGGDISGYPMIGEVIGDYDSLTNAPFVTAEESGS